MNASWRRYLRFWGARVEEDIDDELAFHLEMRAREYMDRGMNERDANAAAMRRVGDIARARATCRTIGHRRQRRMHRAQTLDALVQDLRYALRTLSRQRGWTAVALLTMALGIGASTAVFSAVNSTILNPLPYAGARRVAMIWRVDPKSKVMITPDLEMFSAWEKESRAIEAMERYGTEEVTVTGRGEAAKLGAARIRPTFPAFTGLPLLRGRTFVREELVPGGRQVALISERLWRQQFGGADDVLGQRLMLNDKPVTIIGVAAGRMRLPMPSALPTDVWLPLVKDSLVFGDLTVARLKPGVTDSAARREILDIIKRNNLTPKLSRSRFELQLVRPGDVVSFKTSLYLLAGAVALLLLVACANVAHLLLARGATREREIAIRTALGAGRVRIARQLLTESALLAVAGCVGGVLFAYAGVRALALLRPASLVALAFTSLDSRALVGAVVMSALAGIAFGFTAAFHAIRRTTADSLRGTATSGGGAPATHRLRSLLVITEMALSAMLLVGAALLVRSVHNLQNIDPGFDTANLYSMNVQLPRNRYPADADRRRFMEQVMREAGAIPGVVAVTAAGATPPGIGGFMMSALETRAGMDPAPQAMMMNFITPNYFSTLRLRLEGRTFDEGSLERNDVIVNRAFARKHWPGQPAVGQQMRFGDGRQKSDEGWMTVIGVADEVPTGGAMREPDQPLIYQPMDPRAGLSRISFAVRVKPGFDPVAPLRNVVKTLDDRMIPPAVTTVDADLASSIASQRFTMMLLAVFATLAVVLSAIGLYGVISYVVTQRTREIGIRIALGATPRNVARAVVSRGLVLSTIGLALGLVAAVWGTRVIKSTLYGVTGTDPVSYVATALTLLAVSILACVVPMRRAMRVDPVIAMRGE